MAIRFQTKYGVKNIGSCITTLLYGIMKSLHEAFFCITQSVGSVMVFSSRRCRLTSSPPLRGIHARPPLVSPPPLVSRPPLAVSRPPLVVFRPPVVSCPPVVFLPPLRVTTLPLRCRIFSPPLRVTTLLLRSPSDVSFLGASTDVVGEGA